MIFRLILFYLVFQLIAFSVWGTDYYVSNSGDNGNSGLSLETAFETIQHATDLVSPGDYVYVADGFYTGFQVETSGSEDQPITFKALGQNACINLPTNTMDGINVENADYIIIDGFIVKDQPRNGIRLALSDHCIVRNCWCDNNYERGIFTGFTDDILVEYNVCSNSQDEHGIYISNSSDRPIIRYNECYGNNNIGIHMNGDFSQGGDGIISDAQIFGNFIHDNNLAAGINLDGVENPLIYNNLIINNHSAQGIALFQQDGAIVTHGAKIYNNTIVVPDDGRWGVLLRDGANQNTEIYNNIIINLHSWRGSITCESTNGFSSDHNILINSMSNQGDGNSISLASWQALGLDQNSLPADPLSDIFVAPATGDYRLLPEAQAIDQGSEMLVIPHVILDFANNARPLGAAYDIGAYEFVFEMHSIKYTADADCLELSHNDIPGVVIVEGNLEDYDIILYSGEDQIISDLSGQPEPLNIDLGQLEEEIIFLHIQHSIYPLVFLRVRIRP